ncbi:hypothetical protein O3P69_009245 [Scylla paramamosain]|uniref:Uncharacterized protein n=1 Tax=Scylla paramamosain TaxID=85552 RepID=A0AAW0T9M1_SCYPA
MASWGTVFLLLTVLTAALTRDTASQDLRAPEHGQKSLLVAEGVQEAREARGKEVEVPEEVKAKRILKKKKKMKKEEKKGDQKSEEKKKKRRKKACPGGQCVPSAEQCGDGRAVRAATCKSGVCCVTECKPRNPCKKVWGKCASKKKGCPSGQTMLVSTKEIKYCSKKNCVCCTDEVQQPACVSKKCAKKKGFCTTDKSECSGKIKVQKNFCSGANCVCCLPAKQCKIQKDCLDLGGTCVDMKKSEECKTKPLVGKNYCKGKCGCCVPEGDVVDECG